MIPINKENLYKKNCKRTLLVYNYISWLLQKNELILKE
jgi:hypothetical protein